ncbi:MAG TPA: Lrp/AsnC family transcriptional regulator [Thermoplasmata archaeon]|jgi:DNA-binding Lrp family transcriptional regulator|nr:Lrp/AsnC family transcriptional regulator [Thermoplasmata archaeon]
MDADDVRIFCELAFPYVTPRPPAEARRRPASIARKLGLDEKTVRLRVKKMEEAGFIKYYQATPDLALLGLRWLALDRYEAVNLATKYAVLEHIRGLPGVLEASDYLGPTLAISVAGASAPILEQLGKDIAARFELRKTDLGSGAIGDRRVRPDRIDWRILERLRYDARSTHEDVAAALSITPRMAEYRIRRLHAAGAVQFRAVINPQRQEGLVFYELTVTIERERRTAVVSGVKEKYGDQLWSVRETAPGVLLLNLFGFTLAEPEEAVMELLKVRGVRSCSILILKEIMEPARPNWIDALIRAETSGGR